MYDNCKNIVIVLHTFNKTFIDLHFCSIKKTLRDNLDKPKQLFRVSFLLTTYNWGGISEKNKVDDHKTAIMFQCRYCTTEHKTNTFSHHEDFY